MKLVVGLGNPGAQYEQTRHNVGFHVVDLLAQKMGWSWERRGRAMQAPGMIETEKIVLVKPLTFMNKSGEAVGELMRWYKLQPDDVLVVYDDLDLPVGRVRLRSGGSAGGHNGISNIIQHLHTQEFPRLRVGIGRPANSHMDTINYVLGVPPLDERITLSQGEEQAMQAIPLVITKGIGTAMNIGNADPEAQRKQEEKRRLQLERREQQKRLKEAEAAQKQALAAQVSDNPDPEIKQEQA